MRFAGPFESNGARRVVRRLLTLAPFALIIPVPAAAQRSGLLLGLASDSGYRTLWIAPADGTTSVAAQLPWLIVPRSDAFHHVGVVRWCQLEHREGESSGAGRFVDVTDYVIDRPVGAPADGAPDSTSMRCDEAERVVSVWQDSIARADSVAMTQARTADDSIAAEPPYVGESNVCVFQYASITYLSPRYLSTFQQVGSTEYCEPARYTSSDHRSVLTADSAHDVGLLARLAPAERRRLRRIWQREKGDCALESSPDDSWGIMRGNGEWRVDFATSGAVACRGQSGNEDEGFDIALPAPASMARREPAAKWRRLLAARMPKLDDVFVSPSGDLVVARSADSLTVFVPRDGALGEAALVVPIDHGVKIVMAEWATGQYVDRWTKQLAAIHERW